MLALALLLALATPPEDLAAVGVVLSPRPASSVAILRSAGRSRVVAEGDTAFGVRVVRIAAGTVVIASADGTRELRLTPGTPGGAGARAGVPPRAADTARHAADGALNMDRHEVERRLGAEIPRILAETTLLPVTNGVGTVGFTLTRVPEGSLLTDAGLRAGDVLTHVNDVAIDGLPTLIALWPKLQGASTVRAHVLRNGVPLSLAVNLR